jgi:hypothetical protein
MFDTDVSLEAFARGDTVPDGGMRTTPYDAKEYVLVAGLVAFFGEEDVNVVEEDNISDGSFCVRERVFFAAYTDDVCV